MSGDDEIWSSGPAVDLDRKPVRVPSLRKAAMVDEITDAAVLLRTTRYLPCDAKAGAASIIARVTRDSC